MIQLRLNEWFFWIFWNLILCFVGFRCPASLCSVVEGNLCINKICSTLFQFWCNPFCISLCILQKSTGRPVASSSNEQCGGGGMGVGRNIRINKIRSTRFQFWSNPPPLFLFGLCKSIARPLARINKCAVEEEEEEDLGEGKGCLWQELTSNLLICSPE